MPRRRSCPLLALTLTLAAAGCTDDERDDEPPQPHPMRLAELPELDIRIGYEHSPSADAPVLWIRIDYEDEGLLVCPQLHASFAARLAAVDVPITERGSLRPMTGDYRCWKPVLELTISSELRTPNPQLVLGDDSFSLTIPLGDLLLPRSAVPAGSTGWSFRAGQVVTLEWSPATDLAVLPTTRATFRTTPSGAPAFELQEQITRQLTTLSFTVPEVIGQGTLVLELLDDRYRAGSCGDHCRFDRVSQRVSHEATIVP